MFLPEALLCRQVGFLSFLLHRPAADSPHCLPLFVLLFVQALFTEASAWRVLLFIYDIETDGGDAHPDNPVGIPEFGGVWAAVEWRPGHRPHFVFDGQQWQFWPSCRRARVFRMGERAQAKHGIALKDVAKEQVRFAVLFFPSLCLLLV